MTKAIREQRERAHSFDQWLEREWDQKVRIYDNGGKTYDRFTVIYFDLPRERDGCYQARGMSENPYHGFGLWCAAMPGRHLGQRITFNRLDCIAPHAAKLVVDDLDAITGRKAAA